MHISVRQMVICESSATSLHLNTADWRQQTSCKAVSEPVLWGQPVVLHIHHVNQRFVNEDEGSLKSSFFCEASPDEDLSWDSLWGSWTKFPQQLGAHLFAYQTGSGHREDTVKWKGWRRKDRRWMMKRISWWKTVAREAESGADCDHMKQKWWIELIGHAVRRESKFKTETGI